ncbi:MAG: energy transducer TonB, partial [Proteobacteria bacterium]
TGKVRQANLVSGPGYGMNEAALQAIGSFEFEPAQVGEQAVAVRIRYSYRFVLER